MDDDADLACIHSDRGLCADCQESFMEDHVAFHEYGAHKYGLQRWAELQAEINAENAHTATEVNWDGIPF